MQFDKYGNNNEDNDGVMWQNDEYAAQANSNVRMFNNRGGFRRRGSYNNAARFFNEPGPPLVPRLLEAGFGPSFEWGRGYGPAGPPMPHKYPRGVDTITFLLRCGVPHHILNGLPNSLLRMMGPVLCGVCAQEFNNIDAARFHYTSKNHIKNVKKWLSEQAKVVSQHLKEVPFRARDLYCELCDIHITSKVHAESHYAGRSHRSIVEGRKPPKNVFLLQKNMQERLVKLIRREKRSLKPIEKAAAAVVVKTPPKPTPPELFCKVCQTSVTCSEQMTMHLNGKKHLAKEKRHILNMMQDGKNIHDPAESADTAKDNPAESADTAKDNPAESADTAKDADAQGTDAQGADTQEKEDTNGHEDDGEWSAWDDIPQ